MKENIPGGSRYRTLNWPPSTYRATRSTATGTTRSLQVEKFALAEGLIDRVIYGRALIEASPHTVAEFACPMVLARCGIVGLPNCRTIGNGSSEEPKHTMTGRGVLARR